jgi:hypothetical protein
MSRFMSHREMKAASKVLGTIEEAIAQHSARLYVIEGVLAEMLTRANLTVVVTADQKIELHDDIPVLAEGPTLPFTDETPAVPVTAAELAAASATAPEESQS